MSKSSPIPSVETLIRKYSEARVIKQNPRRMVDMRDSEVVEMLVRKYAK